MLSAVQCVRCLCAGALQWSRDLRYVLPELGLRASQRAIPGMQLRRLGQVVFPGAPTTQNPQSEHPPNQIRGSSSCDASSGATSSSTASGPQHRRHRGDRRSTAAGADNADAGLSSPDSTGGGGSQRNRALASASTDTDAAYGLGAAVAVATRASSEDGPGCDTCGNGICSKRSCGGRI